MFTINRDFWKDALTYNQFYIYAGLLDFGEISWETLTPKAVSAACIKILFPIMPLTFRGKYEFYLAL